MKLSGETLIAPLTWIINQSILSGIVPRQWKKACVTPLHKKSDRFQLENYRPVALLSVPAMILERAVAIQVTRFFEDNKLLGNWMFAYRQNSQEQTNF